MIKPYYSEPNITIYNGDCLEVMKRLPDKSINLIVTDPPYGLSYTGRGMANFEVFANDDLDYMGYRDFLDRAMIDFDRLLKDNSSIYCYTDFRRYPLMYTVMEKYFKIKNCIVWVKNNFGMGQFYRFGYELCIFAIKGNYRLNRHDIGDVWMFKKDDVGSYRHPTQKPKSVMLKPIEYSSQIGDIILDPFLGSGTTARACKDLGRKCIGIEISKKYCDIAVKRLGQEVFNFND